jgi:hypothetical protein
MFPRALLLACTLSLMTPVLASARTQVTAAIGASLQAKAKDYGERDLQDLRKELVETVDHALERASGGVFHPVSVELIIEDAQPSRPTFAQLAHRSGLSMESLSLGGARVSGKVVDKDGVTHPLAIAWFENDIRQESANTTWTDAQRAFERVADGIVSGRLDRK